MLKYCVRCKTRHILRSFWAIEKVPKPKRKTGENRGPKFDQRGVGKKASSTTLLSVSLSTPPFFCFPPSLLPRAISFFFEEREKGTKMRFSNIVGSGSSKRLLLLRPPAAAHLYSSALALLFLLWRRGWGGGEKKDILAGGSFSSLAGSPPPRGEEEECLLSKPPSLLHRRGEGRGLLASSFLGGGGMAVSMLGRCLEF